MSDLSQRLAYKNNIARHLTEMSRLSGRDVSRNELLSIEATASVRESASRIREAPSRCFEIGFDEKASARFLELIKKLHQLNPSSIYVWTTLSSYCGVLGLPSIMELNLGFEYSSSREGIIVLVTANFLDKLLLDFYEAAAGERRLKVELMGENWSKVHY
jgi:hypothetical protein